MCPGSIENEIEKRIEGLLKHLFREVLPSLPVFSLDILASECGECISAWKSNGVACGTEDEIKTILRKNLEFFGKLSGASLPTKAGRVPEDKSMDGRQMVDSYGKRSPVIPRAEINIYHNIGRGFNIPIWIWRTSAGILACGTSDFTGNTIIGRDNVLSILSRSKTCPNCSIDLPKDAIFCNKCGTAVTWPLPAPNRDALLAVERDALADLERDFEIIPQFTVVEGHVTELFLPGRVGSALPLPDNIGNLTSLIKLNLDHNQVGSLPATIGNLTTLQQLKLGVNRLTSLPEAIGQLKSLQTLWLNGNELSSLPETLGNLNELRELKLVCNKLSSLPESIGQLKSLQELSLGDNKLSSLPEAIGQLTSLKNLDIQTNMLSSLPESIGQLKSLKNLSISTNKLSSLVRHSKVLAYS